MKSSTTTTTFTISGDLDVKRPARKAYRFDNLADIERLEIVANDPAFHLLCTTLPQIGTTTKPSVTSTTGMMLLGAATIIFDSDEGANAELRAHWQRIHKIFTASNVPAPNKALTAQQWIDFRDVFLGRDPDLNAVINQLGALMPETRRIGNDDEATEALDRAWRRIRRECAKAGVCASDDALNAQQYRVFRDAAGVNMKGVKGGLADRLAKLVPAAVEIGNDDAATAALAVHWDEVITIFAAAGHRVPLEPMNAQQYRRFRDSFAESKLRAVNAGLRDVFEQLAIGQARDMGLLDAHVWEPTGRQGWFTVPQQRVVTADGTWFEEHSNVRRLPGLRKARITRARKRASDTEVGVSTRTPRTSRGVDTRGNATGYAHVLVAVRGPKRRQSAMLSVVPTVRGIEMAAVIPVLERIGKALLGARLAFVYDGAMRGVHHALIRVIGMMSLNKAHGFDGQRYQQMLHTPVPKDDHVHTVEFPTSNGAMCPKQVTFAAGMMFVVETDQVGIRRRIRIADHQGIVSRHTPQGWAWELDLAVYCKEHDEYHVRTVDPNDKLVGVALAENLRVIPPNRPEFDRVYGYRNWSEAKNNYIKNVIMSTQRAKSVSAQRHELDLILAAVISNALAWAEHGTDRYLAVPGRA